MVRLTTLEHYSDERGNTIVHGRTRASNIKVKFTGSNNRLVVADDVRMGYLIVDFDCDNGVVEIASNASGPPFSLAIRVGQDSEVRIGRNVSSTSRCFLSAAEGARIVVGDDVMLASHNQIRADDGHAIFDVRTGKRVNVSRSITIGDHVWLARGVVVLGGVTIGDGTVVGYGSIVTKSLPNNCIAAGVPARVVRRDVAWERKHLTLDEPFYKPDASTVIKSRYWHTTAEPRGTGGTSPRELATRLRRALRWRARRVANRVQARTRT